MERAVYSTVDIPLARQSNLGAERKKFKSITSWSVSKRFASNTLVMGKLSGWFTDLKSRAIFSAIRDASK